MDEEIVELNVGGVHYTVSRDTLVGKHNADGQAKNIFAAMNSGDFCIELDKENRIWLDRDGILFRYILNYLRDGAWNLPEDFTEHAALHTEAKFYGLTEPAVDVGAQFVLYSYRTLLAFVDAFIVHFTPYLKDRLGRGQVVFRLFVVVSSNSATDGDTVSNEDWFKSISEFREEWCELLGRKLHVRVTVEGSGGCRVFSFSFKEAVKRLVFMSPQESLLRSTAPQDFSWTQPPEQPPTTAKDSTDDSETNTG
eukprot:TRINITY_DN44173_c0_g1_i1.p1 TRINITY_DN44173_c0_g1~~TRINITY_DN44173_c0_g1_i1.p1  ORF type:complete len:252 (+),score=43.23 TRINITY_DN44173_c0_g1_i1:49-804(+)